MQMYSNGYCNVLDLRSMLHASREEMMHTLLAALCSRHRKIVHEGGRLADIIRLNSRGLGQQEVPLQAVNICDTQVFSE